MSQTITTISREPLFRRGDYVEFWLAGGKAKARVLSADGTTLTTRKVGDLAWFEAVSRRIEDWLLFPAADFGAFIVRIWRALYSKRGVKTND